MQRIWKVIVAFFLTFLSALLWLPGAVGAQSKVFTTEELAKYDGRNGNPAYYAYEGQVYDVTGSQLWKEGQHYGLQAGQDLTGKMVGAPHGTEVFKGFTVVGTYTTPAAPAAASETKAVVVAESAPMPESSLPKPWYANRIRIAGFSILGWTGILLGVFFVLTFATCFAMPWAKLPLPWKGSKLGPDPLDKSGQHLNWSSVHKYFVWFTVILGLVHGLLGLLQMVWGLYL